MMAFDPEILEHRRNRLGQRRLQIGTSVDIGDEYMAYDTVPIGLRILGSGVAAGVSLRGQTAAVVGATAQLIACLVPERQMALLGGGDVITAPDALSVEKYLGGLGSVATKNGG